MNNPEQDRHKRMWAEIRRELKLKPNEDWPSWEKCADVAEKLGYNDYATRWRESLVDDKNMRKKYCW